MLEIAICDDEIVFAQKLKTIVEGYLDSLQMSYGIDIYSSGKELLDMNVDVRKYKIIFLDISMDEIDGISVAKNIRSITEEPYIVFVTAFINYALDGYSVDAIRYLLKSKEKFEDYVKECMDAILTKMKVNINKKEISFLEGKRVVSLNSILYIESKLHKLEYHILEDKVQIYTQYEVLNRVESEYIQNGFIRSHQSYLVNMKHIKELKVDNGRYIMVLSNGDELIIPKKRYREVKEAYVTYRGEF